MNLAHIIGAARRTLGIAALVAGLTALALVAWPAGVAARPAASGQSQAPARTPLQKEPETKSQFEPCTQAQAKLSAAPVDAQKWLAARFGRGAVPPFSFDYGGKPSSALLPRWNYAAKRLTSDEPNVARWLYTYRDPASGLSVECRAKAFADFNAVEWVLRFTNTSSKNSLPIEHVKVVDLGLESPQDAFTVYYADGSHASKADFHPRQKRLAPGESVAMASQGGRSSQMGFPFFNVASGDDRGAMVAVGWTGNWTADVVQERPGSVGVTAGMRNFGAYLYPQETVRTPSVCLLFWQGANRFAGHNKFRRFVLEHHTAKVDGRRAVYPVSSSFNYGDPAPCNEYSCLTADYAVAMVKRYAQFKLVPEVFWLDAGWYTGAGDVAHGKNWANTVGNWSVDSVRFPEGMMPISDEVHKLGARFMVWFEPERVMKGSAWAVAHPEYMLDARGKAHQPDWIKDGEHDAYLFDLGNPKALQWMCRSIGDLLEENGIDYYRQDFNIEPEGFWAANDEPGRKGICEVRYIEGLYAYWDYLRDRFPGLLIDNCASGGRRIDLESISRGAPLWRTDYHYGEPVGYQCHTYGLNLFLPLSGTGTQKTDRFTFRSSLGTSIVYNWKITDGSMSVLDMQACRAEFCDVRPYFYEDYYPLTGTEETTSDDIWLAYELHRPSDDSGYIVAFRREGCPERECTVKLYGLDAETVYELDDKDSGATVTKTGRELSDGLVLTLEEPRSSLLLKFQPVKR